jgi:phage-related minor tail protein
MAFGGSRVAAAVDNYMTTATDAVRNANQEIITTTEGAWVKVGTFVSNMKTALAGVPAFAESYVSNALSQLASGVAPADLTLSGSLFSAPAGLDWSGVPFSSFADGGVVPGTGPRLAIVHGGETVIPVGGGNQTGGGNLHVTVMLPDGSVLGKTVQKWAAQDMMRGGAGVPG